MKVVDIFEKDKLTLSFEFFPPKTEDQERNLFYVISELKNFNPDFVSVTYGAMGTTRDKTFLWSKKIKHELKIEPVVHLTCVYADKDTVEKQVRELKKYGIENILALRGDPPIEDIYIPPKNGFLYAKDLVSFVKEIACDFCVGVAGFPEGHCSISDLSVDTNYLKEKIESGAEYVITQMFFDNRYFFDFKERCEKKEISVPIIPGIMPITNVGQIKKMTQICGATIPKELLNKIEKHSSDYASVMEIGVEHAIKQTLELVKNNVLGLHFFVMNQSGPVSKVLSAL
ncbi:methylenetetrahydrofolate reductase [NAD(P)H] [candidate division WOR-1 bacterium RIFOXYA2_FULL_36_21]|uniref:Methylenetetrahydrofolate reductase n=1 Tax=candidate division WOR-1 bacterium RIFOXYB2_FULL_36_35 TaxID=1802578 RepID=A0A1F4S2B8_UNCSA|nr:MAG: methylenetetrahydrofolate reductase [NAD(P)H] [candidate division WOR-1 bacterium RIFOXYA2_FULL_36_21]OGC14582.1 MAG: methylenetetrahydrofolate reductase [NAD(P)H] [candidate division WOR-1 bacterium RIFOXYB2_FULL_36_35]OGC16254.1 MAG: methylenetetrahydrofolate reductase [NAD(P)H] [candidate division WOR-1 bacterium RIFOXYA12_FULL_36_13]